MSVQRVHNFNPGPSVLPLKVLERLQAEFLDYKGSGMSVLEISHRAADYKEINETPGVTPGVQMQDPETATTVRVEDGRTLTTDGPFAELKEAIGGYLFFEADDLDAAIALAAKVPAASMGGAVEVRPLME